jgi:hypothetical protein
VPKSAPADIVRIALDGIEAGLLEIVVDDWSAHVKASLSADPALFLPAGSSGVLSGSEGTGSDRCPIRPGPFMTSSTLSTGRPDDEPTEPEPRPAIFHARCGR